MDDGSWMTTMRQLQCDGNVQPATCRTLASAAPPIQGNNQQVWTIWGGGDKREGQFGGIEPQKRVKVDQSIPNQPSAHPRGSNSLEPILHASWELGCTIGTMVSTSIVIGVFTIVVIESLMLLTQRRLCRL